MLSHVVLTFAKITLVSHVRKDEIENPLRYPGFDDLMVGAINIINDFYIKRITFIDKFACTNLLVAQFWAISLAHKNDVFQLLNLDVG